MVADPGDFVPHRGYFLPPGPPLPHKKVACKEKKPLVAQKWLRQKFRSRFSGQGSVTPQGCHTYLFLIN
jgi:hypothetical protein